MVDPLHVFVRVTRSASGDLSDIGCLAIATCAAARSQSIDQYENISLCATLPAQIAAGRRLYSLVNNETFAAAQSTVAWLKYYGGGENHPHWQTDR